MVYKDILVSVIFFFSFEANTAMDSLYHVLIIAEKKEQPVFPQRSKFTQPKNGSRQTTRVVLQRRNRCVIDY